VEKENKLKTRFSDEEFENLPDEGTLWGAKESHQEKEPVKVTGLTSFVQALKQGPPGGWMKAVKEEITKPLDPSAQAMVDSAKVLGAAVPAQAAEAYVFPAARAVPEMATNFVKHYGKDALKYGAGAVGLGAILRRMQGHGE